MRIGIDLDGVVVDTYTRVTQYYSEYFSKSAKLKDFPSHTKIADFINEFYGLSREDAKTLWLNDMNYIFQSAPPVKSAINALKELDEKGIELYYISARPNNLGVKETTLKWLKYYELPCFNNLIINQSSKVQTSLDLKLRYFIEDASHHISMLVENNIKVVCLQTPYNQMVNENKLIKIQPDWDKTKDYLLNNILAIK